MEKGIFLCHLLYIIMHHKDGLKQNNVEPVVALCALNITQIRLIQYHLFV